jgi:hypothetical protein
MLSDSKIATGEMHTTAGTARATNHARNLPLGASHRRSPLALDVHSGEVER